MNKLVPQGVADVKSLSDLDFHQIAILVIKQELSIEVVRIRNVVPVVSRQRFPNIPQAIDVTVMGIEDGIVSGEAENPHIGSGDFGTGITSPIVHRTMRESFDGSSS